MTGTMISISTMFILHFFKVTFSWGLNVLQVIRYPRFCSHYSDFGYHHKLLVHRLLSEGYEIKWLRNSFKKFYGGYPDLFRKYQWSSKDMVYISNWFCCFKCHFSTFGAGFFVVVFFFLGGGCHMWDRQWLSTGLISHDSIQFWLLLALLSYFSILLDMSFSFVLCSLLEPSLEDQFLLNSSSVCFSGVLLSMRLSSAITVPGGGLLSIKTWRDPLYF